MSRIEVEGISTSQGIDITQHPDYLKHKAMIERGQRIFADESLPQVVRDDGQRDVMRHSVAILRQFDPLYTSNEVAIKALMPSKTADELLLEATYAHTDDSAPKDSSER